MDIKKADIIGKKKWIRPYKLEFVPCVIFKFNQFFLYNSQWARKVKKVQAKKLVKWNESISRKKKFRIFAFSESKILILMENIQNIFS